MSRNLKLYIAGVVAASVVALVATTLLFPVAERMPIALGIRRSSGRTGATARDCPSGSWRPCWPRRCPIRMPRGAHVRSVSASTVMAATILGGPDGRGVGWPPRHYGSPGDSVAESLGTARSPTMPGSCSRLSAAGLVMLRCVSACRGRSDSPDPIVTFVCRTGRRQRLPRAQWRVWRRSRSRCRTGAECLERDHRRRSCGSLPASSASRPSGGSWRRST